MKTIALLSSLAATKDCRTPAALAAEVGAPLLEVERQIGALYRRGLIEPTRRGCYRATRSGRKAARAAQEVAEASRAARRANAQRPRAADPHSFRSRLWRAFRTVGKGTIDDLLVFAARPEEAIDLGRLRARAAVYLRGLAAAGYAIKMARRAPGSKPNSKGHARYLLAPDKNTGPLCPRLGARGRLYDPNLKRFVSAGRPA